MRVSVIGKNKCIAPKECPYTCQKVCPLNRAGKDCITLGPDQKPIINEEICIACGFCVKKCPAQCISVINLPEELKSQALHRYSKNGFKLFRTIVPIFGKAVGVLGPNGIGKTTAISILAGLTYPNLGVPGDKPSEKQILNFFKGTEAQGYFQKLFDKKIDVAYKPQYVDAIPKQFKGKVSELLKQMGKTDSGELVKNLELGNVLGRNLDQLSGGELQRVAIAATILKGANVMLFDEPSSYLDIKQRLNVAELVYSLAKPSVSVSVIEHDLIVLDYVSDLVHLMFGQTGVYGVVSHPLASKEGINTYLDGYLPDENIRFRDAAIKFEVTPPSKSKKVGSLIEWPELKKQLGDFALNVSGGAIHYNEIVGVLGENATGKTTFAKMLAGELKPDSGTLPSKIRISYKPQYIKPDSDETVANTLRSISKAYGSDEFRLQIIRPLQLDTLLSHRINELSGGELQRVAIAICLAREADVYLLDEPSAYLDVEQRLLIAKAIGDVIKKRASSAIVIDHDLLFLDHISDRLMVFRGVPSRSGETLGPTDLRTGMNSFLKEVNITLRRDGQTNRPRINKLDSVKDREQKQKGEYYYA